MKWVIEYRCSHKHSSALEVSKRLASRLVRVVELYYVCIMTGCFRTIPYVSLPSDVALCYVIKIFSILQCAPPKPQPAESNEVLVD
jgi:hypothetical protein